MQTSAQEKPETNKIAALPIKRLIWQLGLPMIVSMVLQAVYNIVDTVFVVNMGADGAAGNLALTYAFPIQILMIAVGVGTGIGINALLSKSLGEGDRERAARVVGNGLFLIAVLYAVFLLFGIFGAEAFIRMQAGEGNERAVEMGTAYLRICCIVSVGSVGYAVAERFLQATGKTGLSTVSQITGAVLNIVLDYVFIYPLNMGIAGAAWATVIGQIAAMALALFFHYTRNRDIGKSLRYARPRREILGGIYRVGLSAAIMQALLSVMMLGMNLILGTAADAKTLQGAFGIYYKIMQFALFAFFGVSNTLITVLSFNYGMGDKARVRQGIRWGIIDCVLVALVITALFECIASPLAKLFSLTADVGAGVGDVVVLAIRIAAIGYVFMALSVAVQGVLQAFRYAVLPLLISVLRLIVFVLPTAYWLSRGDNAADVVWWSLVICEVLTAAVSVVILRAAYRRKVVPMREPHPSGEGLVVTVSREHGSNGKYIGKLVAEKLGIAFFDKEIAARVAEETGLAREYLEKPVRDVPNFNALYLSCEPNRAAIIAQAKVIRKIAAENACVIVGRGADYILRKRANCIKVFVRADEEYKVRTVMRLYGDDEASARRHVARADAARGAYYRFLSGQAWGDTAHYDLCVNASVGAEAAADLIVRFVRSRLSGARDEGARDEGVRDEGAASQASGSVRKR